MALTGIVDFRASVLCGLLEGMAYLASCCSIVIHVKYLSESSIHYHFIVIPLLYWMPLLCIYVLAQAVSVHVFKL